MDKAKVSKGVRFPNVEYVVLTVLRVLRRISKRKTFRFQGTPLTAAAGAGHADVVKTLRSLRYLFNE